MGFTCGECAQFLQLNLEGLDLLLSLLCSLPQLLLDFLHRVPVLAWQVAGGGWRVAGFRVSVYLSRLVGLFTHGQFLFQPSRLVL